MKSDGDVPESASLLKVRKRKNKNIHIEKIGIGIDFMYNI